MDGMNFSDLSAIMNALKENPQMLQLLSSLISSGGQAKARQDQQNSDSFASLMSMLGGAKAPNESTRDRQNVPSATKLSSVLGSPEEIKNRIVLLSAIRPYLSETRKDRLEAVIKLLRLAELGGLSSLLG